MQVFCIVRQACQLDQQPTSLDRMTDLNADRARGERAAALEESILIRRT